MSVPPCKLCGAVVLPQDRPPNSIGLSTRKADSWLHPVSVSIHPGSSSLRPPSGAFQSRMPAASFRMTDSFVIVDGNSPTNQSVGAPPSRTAHSARSVEANNLQKLEDYLHTWQSHSDPMKLCEKCWADMERVLDAQIAAEQKQEQACRFLQQQLRQQPELSYEISQQIHLARAEAESHTSRLASLHTAWALCDQQQKALDDETRRVDELEASYWKEFAAFEAAQMDCSRERQVQQTKFEQVTAQLQRVRRFNVYQDLFSIDTGGNCATINSLRLGYVPHDRARMDPPWEEINAALGYVCLLLASISARVQCNSSRFALYPRGSTSAILRLEEHHECALFYSTSLRERFLGVLDTASLDDGLLALVGFVQELASSLSRSPGLPDTFFEIGPHGTVGGKSVCINGDFDNWTLAMKYFLHDVKCFLVVMARENL